MAASTTSSNAPSPSATTLRHLADRLVGILHGCLKTRTRYDETTAWAHHANKAAA